MSTDSAAAPTLRVMALHALAYCERLFYLEEVEEIRIADAAVYAGRRLHEELTADEVVIHGYAQVSTQAIIAVGLEPAFGFFHRPRSAAHPLALDLMELFRVPLWDMPLVASVNRLQWNTKHDFVRAGKQVWLSDSGRKKAIGVYERRKEDHWRHPVTGYALSYARLVELEARLLEKEWAGESGLFARMRLR